MLPPLDRESAFAAIVDELELPLVLLANPDPRVRLAMLEKIGKALSSTNLTFRDLAVRVVGTRPAGVDPAAPPLPPMPLTPLRPQSEIAIDPAAVLSDDELRRLGGYRTPPALHFGRYGYGPVPDTFEAIPGESDEDVGQRLALWAIAKTGQPFWEDPTTGRGYLPGVTVPGRGKVRSDGTLGPMET